MPKPLASVGDLIICINCGILTYPHPGHIISGSSHVLNNGKPIARVGDTAICTCGNIVTLITGDATTLIEGKPAHRVGDLNSSGGYTVGDGNSRTFIGK